MPTLTLKRPMAGWRTDKDIDVRFRESCVRITAEWHKINRHARTRRYIERTALRGHAVMWRRVVMGGGRALGG